MTSIKIDTEKSKRLKFPGPRKSIGPAERPFSDYKLRENKSKAEADEENIALNEKVCDWEQ